MTADAAHVAAVTEALHPSHDWGACNCRAIATVAVETLTPLIRAQIAAEILAERDRIRKQYESWLHVHMGAVEPGSRDYDSEVAMDTLTTVARLVREAAEVTL